MRRGDKVVFFWGGKTMTGTVSHYSPFLATVAVKPRGVDHEKVFVKMSSIIEVVGKE